VKINKPVLPSSACGFFCVLYVADSVNANITVCTSSG
jgi:hypothetical protein